MAVAIGAHPDYPLIVAHNRDEHLARTATPLAQHNEVICATDEESGGTWMGMNVVTGVIAALTNVRAHGSGKPGTRSRGELVSRVLAGDVPAATTATSATSAGATPKPCPKNALPSQVP